VSRRVPLIGLWLALGLYASLSGCVYYNGMYNANRLAKSARKAERDGRTFEANNLWGQVATKAESVLVRHPSSKYAEQADLLRGVALARLGQCNQAMGSLNRLATSTSRPSDLREDALLSTGRCQMASGNLAAADAAFTELLDSKNVSRRREARFQHARVLRQAGDYAAALTALSEVHDPRADSERILSLSGAGRVPEALSLSDSMLARGDSAVHWDSLVVIMAAQSPLAASALVDRVQRLPRRTPELQARTYLDDGLRLSTLDTSRARQRFEQAVKVGGIGESAGRARLALLQLQLSSLNDPHGLEPMVDSLKQLALRYEAASAEIGQFASAVAKVDSAARLANPGTPQGDLRVFLAAESARETLKAPRLAEALFRRVPEQWPFSPYAPKAILAAQQLNPAWADSARSLLESQYYDSPYVAMVQGDAPPELRRLEDSLSVFSASMVPKQQPPAVRRRPVVAPPAGSRPEPASGGSRVPEPQ
jgi:hypothetical protein